MIYTTDPAGNLNIAKKAMNLKNHISAIVRGWFFYACRFSTKNYRRKSQKKKILFFIYLPIPECRSLLLVSFGQDNDTWA